MISQQEKQIILTMRQQGATYPHIANLMELPPNTVKSICRRNKINVPNPEIYPADRCKNCGATLKQTPGVKKRTFCSDQCRYTWWNRNRLKQPYRLVCYQCGKSFISYGNKHRKFCGRECCNISRYGEGLP